MPRALMAPPGIPEFISRERTVEPASRLRLARGGPGRAGGRSSWSSVGRRRRKLAGGGAGRPAGPHVWRGWSCQWRPAGAGRYELCCTATDADREQPAAPAAVEPGRRPNNAVQRVPVVNADSLAGVAVEEVQPVEVDSDRKTIARFRVGVTVDADPHAGTRGSDGHLGVFQHCAALRAEPGGGASTSRCHEKGCAEILDEGDLAHHRRLRITFRQKRFQRLNPDPDDDVAVDMAGEAGFAGNEGRRQCEPAVAENNLRPIRSARKPSSEQVHRRRADEAGDEQVRRVVVERCGASDLLQPARAITATLSPIVIASTWSWVT